MRGESRGGGGEVTGSDGKIGDGRWGEGQTDEANIALLFLSRQSHACSTPRIWERAGLHAFCLTHTAILCPSGFKSWQWTCCLCFCSSCASSACSCTTRAPGTGEGRGIPTAVLHPQHPAAPFLLLPPATRGNGRTSHTPKHFTHPPRPATSCTSALPQHESSTPSTSNYFRRDDSPQQYINLQQIGKIKSVYAIC